MKAKDYTWGGWDSETDLGNDNDREGVEYLTIYEDGEELAVIVHRSWGDDRDIAAKERKERNADMIVSALNGRQA